MKDDPITSAFQTLACEFLSQHGAIAHRWTKVPSLWSGDRLDLVCAPDTPEEVWVTLRPGMIAVGDRDEHMDFPDDGVEKREAAVIAKEAFDEFLGLLRLHRRLLSEPLR